MFWLSVEHQLIAIAIQTSVGHWSCTDDNNEWNCFGWSFNIQHEHCSLFNDVDDASNDMKKCANNIKEVGKTHRNTHTHIERINKAKLEQIKNFYMKFNREHG